MTKPTLIGHPPIFWQCVEASESEYMYVLARRFQSEDRIDYAVGNLYSYDRLLADKKKKSFRQVLSHYNVNALLRDVPNKHSHDL